MQNFEASYLVDGSNALKLPGSSKGAHANIIAFPQRSRRNANALVDGGIRPEGQADSKAGYARAVLENAASEGFIAKGLRSGSLKGLQFGSISRLEATITGIVFSAIAFGVLFLSI